jgi:hypothetical protein
MKNQVCSTYTSNGHEGDIPCENCGYGPDAHERKAQLDSYPDRYEIHPDPQRAAKVVFAKNSDASYGYDCWFEGRQEKPISGRAVTSQEFLLLKELFKKMSELDDARKSRELLCKKYEAAYRIAQGASIEGHLKPLNNYR